MGTYNKDRYWKKRTESRCTACDAPTDGKSRCPKCMKDVARASMESMRKRIQRSDELEMELFQYRKWRTSNAAGTGS